MKFHNLTSHPLVTVIIPVYNIENYVDECIISVLNQTYKNIEVIIIDDGSTDKSGAKCDRYCDDLITVIHQENKGLAETRNVGIAAANGEYIYFIDSDDYISKTLIENLLVSIVKTGSLIACCDYTRKKDELYSGYVLDAKIMDTFSAINGLFNDRGYRFYVWNKMFHRSIFEHVSFPKGELYEDIKPMYQAFKSVNHIAYVNKPLYFYRNRPDSITHKYIERSYDRVRAINYIMRDCKDNHELFNSLIPKYASNYLYYLNESYRAGVVIPKVDKKLQRIVKRIMMNIFYADGLDFSTKISLLVFSVSPILYRFVYMIYFRLKLVLSKVLNYECQNIIKHHI